jgi:hypothetical protein
MSRGKVCKAALGVALNQNACRYRIKIGTLYFATQNLTTVSADEVNPTRLDAASDL